MRLLVALNLLIVIVFVWSQTSAKEARQQLDDAAELLANCNENYHRIIRGRARASSVGIAPSNYDCSRDIIRLMTRHKIVKQNPITSRFAGQKEKSLTLKTIDNPISEPVRINQLAELLKSADSNEVRFFVDSIELQRLGKRSGINEYEYWNLADLNFKYVTKSQD